MGLILFIASILGSAILFIPGFVWGICKCFWQRRFISGMRELNKKLWVLAASVDKYGNVICAELFNDVLISKSSSYKFGDISQTISMVLGYNQRERLLTKKGEKVVKLLNKFEKDHCLKSIPKSSN